MSFNQVKKEYDSQAGTYSEYTATPLGKLETQLLASALGDCTGAAVLDRKYEKLVLSASWPSSECTFSNPLNIISSILNCLGEMLT